jgi:hypothetical protein
MKPVMQEIIEKGSGDCFSACLASLLEVPLEDVPKFRRDNPFPNDMMGAAREWVKDRFGLSLVTIQMEDRAGDFIGTDIRIIGALKGTPCMAGGTSPNFEGVNHCVVGEIDGLGNFTMTHDPSPHQKGIEGFPKHIYLLVPLAPQNNG